MAYTQSELSGPVQFGDDVKKWFYDAEDAGDSFATVTASGYFNNFDDSIRMTVDDIIEVKTSAGVFDLQVTAISSTGGPTTTTYVGGDYPVESATSGAISGFGLTILAGAVTGNEKVYMLPGPTRAGQRKSVLVNTATDHSIVSTGTYAFGSTGETSITMIGAIGAQGKAGVELLAVSTTQYVIVGHVVPTTGFISST